MTSEYVIEVCVEDTDSTTDRGRLLEEFAGRFMRSQGFSVQSQVRLTGLEVDLLCEDTESGEIAFVECKAYRSTISADIITKLFGTVMMKSYSAGWLICTHALGKDAKGLEREWAAKSPEERRKLRILSPAQLMPRLISSRTVVDPDELPVGQGRKRTGDAYLLLTKRGSFWGLPLVDPETGIAGSVAVYDAVDGKPISASALLAWILQTDTTLKNLSPATAPAGKSDRLRLELENIVGVPMADHWADYRPSRPIDFVGRESVQKEIFSFLDQVRSSQTSTRLLALKAPSGWGKSSAVLKIVDKAKSRLNKKKYFVHAVDSRGASTERFPELALVSAINACVTAGFLRPVHDFTLGSVGAAFSTESIQGIFRQLKKDGKVLCLFFDQFEELLYKEELSEVFEQMRQLCASVEEAQENLVIGFSWKTDGTITTDHGAYHLWHGLSDRRYEIDLPPFNDREVSLALGKFARELGEPLAPQLRRLLEDHCQGFPWLLKKLCVNILDVVRAGQEQNDVLASGLNIGELFRKDVQNLTQAEFACLKQIGRDSPAEYFKVVNIYGEAVASLINKRLVIRSGVRLSLYWDIFREFVLTDRIPYIPVTYVPQANFSLYIKALRALLGRDTVTYQSLADATLLTGASTDNLVRDLVNIGHAEASRKEGLIRPLFDDAKSAGEIALAFWSSHEIVKKVDEKFGDGPISIDEFMNVFAQTHLRKQYAPQTLNVYGRRTLKWLIHVGLMDHVVHQFYMLGLPGFVSAEFLADAATTRGRGLFLGEAPPEAVCAALDILRAGPMSRTDVERLVSRNAVSALLSLRFAEAHGPEIRPVEVPSGSSTESYVRQAATDQWTISIALEELTLDPQVRGETIAERIAEELEVRWSQGSMNRYGSGLKRWAVWLSG